MTRHIKFTKMVASGNDFVVIEKVNLYAIRYPLSAMVKRICDRKYGVGADGLLLLEKSSKADIRMRIFNPDGSEPSMCGNGLRCVALYSIRSKKSSLASSQAEIRNQIRIETKAGIIQARINKDRVKIKMTEPKGIKLGLPVKLSAEARPIKVDFIDTGVPHTVIFVEGLDKIDVVGIGRQVRFHKKFRPEGTNVDFVQVIDDNNIRIRTYERGVEDETLACGTGAVAAALIYVTRYPLPVTRKINVLTRSQETLRVEFERINNEFEDVWLEGKARIVHRGVYYV